MGAESLLFVPDAKDLNAILSTGKPAEVVVDVEDELSWVFPSIDPGNRPLGARVIVQLRRTRTKTKSGIMLATDTKQAEQWNNQVAKVIAVGPLAYRNRDTKDAWPEGAWCNEGDYVRVPRWGGDRWTVKHGDDEITCCVFMDHEIIAAVTGDPLQQKNYIL